MLGVKRMEPPQRYATLHARCIQTKTLTNEPDSSSLLAIPDPLSVRSKDQEAKRAIS